MILFEDKTFQIINSRGEYILVRKNYPHKFYGHFKNLKGAKTVIELFEKKLIPYKKYFEGSMKRIATEEELLEFSKQKQKPKYRNKR